MNKYLNSVLNPIYSGIFTIIFLLFPTTASAAQNGPVELLVGIGGMLIIVVIVLLFANKANQSAEDPDNLYFANTDTLYAKLSHHLDLSGAYDVHVLRQSGNVERTIEGLDVNEVAKQIIYTMNRSKIDTVSIRGDRSRLELYRVMHNGRGRQEGKRIGGFDIQKVGQRETSIISDNEQILLNDIEEIEPVKLILETDNEAKKALVKAFFNVISQIDNPPQGIVESFDPETGEGRASLEVGDMIVFLAIADKYLTGTGILTDEIRKQLVNSDAAWQREVGNNTTLHRMMGIIGFGDASPLEIQEEFKTLWETSDLMLNLHGDTRMNTGYKDRHLNLMEQSRPEILDMRF